MVSSSPRRGAMGAAHDEFGQSWKGKQSPRSAYAMLGFKLMPKVLLTITAAKAVSERKLLKETERLAHFINEKMYGKKYNQRQTGLKGFGAVEYQTNGNPHVHFALTNHLTYKQYGKLVKVLAKQVAKISTFDMKGVDIRRIGQSDDDYLSVGSYIAKDSFKGGRMVTIDWDGIY